MSINIPASQQYPPNKAVGPLTRYVDFSISNATGDANKVAEFYHTYNSDILPKADEYLVAPLSYKIPVQSLPLYIFPVEPGQADSNLSTIQVGVCHNMMPVNVAAGQIEVVPEFLEPLTWTPQVMGIPAPDQTTTTVQTVTPYYYLYSVEHFVNLVNDAVSDSWIAANEPGNLTSGVAPVFKYDEVNTLFKWELDSNFTNSTDGGAGNGWSVCWNQDFDNLLNTFNVIQDGSDFYILETTKSAPEHTVGNTITLVQDNSTIEYFNSVERILMVTNSIPITQDFFPSGEGQAQGLSAKQSVLCDFIPDYDNNLGAIRSPIVYNPNNLEWSDMNSPLPLRSISVRFVWIDNKNVAHDIHLGKGENIPVRLEFRHKSLGL